MQLNFHTRPHILSNLPTQVDIIVIGGGASGLGAALEACTRGYTTLLLEQQDFAKGTSGKSTKLVHGGVRYLAQGDIKLVREASLERASLLQNASHLVHTMQFIVPVYSFWEKIKYTLGLKIYDAIAGRRRLGHARFINRRQVLQAIPALEPDCLHGGVVYHDGQFDDARLALNLAQTLVENGGHCINYARVTRLIKTGSTINGVEFVDTETGTSYNVNCRAVINATGVFVDRILQLDRPEARPTITVSQGVHLVFDRDRYQSRKAMMIPKTSDGRVLFAVPWHDKLLIGTTDTPVADISLDPLALETEIDFILATANAYLSLNLSRADIRSIFAGLRPLAAPAEGQKKTKEISRSHKIVASGSGLFTMLGGKWTTYRKMGEDTVDLIEKELRLTPTTSNTANLAIHGSKENRPTEDPLYFYGSDYHRVMDAIENDTDGWYSKRIPVHRQQVKWAVDYEMCRTTEDFLARRTRALLLDAVEALRIAPMVNEYLAQLLDRDADWKEKDLAEFRKLAIQYLPAHPNQPTNLSR